ncbi:putative metal-dependent hydrolase [Enhygromyxa salina]|uniref:Putative metal-dependent hydrolase n=2 Tax=Enhygromyxa salina TaxID=215803 RepID=A0A2S9YI45_9BACT|nr:putative metal-dependent hydrolase [Enhygromyxa salina]
MDFDFEGGEIPRHWAGGSVVGTAIANSLNLVFPDGERFFVRSVNHFLDQIHDPGLRDRVKRFYGQEGQHAREHERLFEIMRGHGYDIDAFLVPYRRVAYELLAPALPPKLRLSITAALEHFTACFAEHALTVRILDEFAPPVMAELLLWHAAEEIEHKDVAFEVLQVVDSSYALRVAGLVAATLALLGFWTHGVVVLLGQEPELAWRDMIRDYAEIRRDDDGVAATMPAAFLAYLAPDFHPAKVPNDALARDYLESIGRRQA